MKQMLAWMRGVFAAGLVAAASAAEAGEDEWGISDSWFTPTEAEMPANGDWSFEGDGFGAVGKATTPEPEPEDHRVAEEWHPGEKPGPAEPEKWGSYEVVHRERFPGGYEAVLLKSGDSMRFDVTFEGQPVCEVEVDPEETRAVVIPYRSGHPEDHATLFYQDGKMPGVRQMTRGNEMVMLFDNDGDGYPDKRATFDTDGPRLRMVEELAPHVVSTKLPDGPASPQASPGQP